MKNAIAIASLCLLPGIVLGSTANLRSDFNADGQADQLWHNTINGKSQVWLSGKAGKKLPVAPMADLDWFVAGYGDFNGDNTADILWRNISTGANTIWLSVNSETPQAVTTLAGDNWTVAGIADFNGDGSDDILWHNTSNNSSVIWLAADSAATQSLDDMPSSDWHIVGIGDYNGDGKADVLWRNMASGENIVWYSADSATPLTLSALPDQHWQVAASADFNGDGADDILWYNNATGETVLWPSANPANAITLTTQTDLAWVIANAADYDGDSKADILWRNRQSGKNLLWLSGDSNTPLKLAARSAKKWEASSVQKVHLTTAGEITCTVSKPCTPQLWLHTWGGLPPYHYQHDTFRNGTTPPGTVIGLDGHLAGTPTRTGKYTFGLCAVDLGGNFDCQPVRVIVKPVQLVKIQIYTDIKPYNSMLVTFDDKVIRETTSIGANSTQAIQSVVISTTVGEHTMCFTPTADNYYCDTYFNNWLPSKYHRVTPSDVCYGLDIAWQTGVKQCWPVTVQP